MDNKEFRKTLKRTKESEKELFDYYKKYFIIHTKKLNGLYKNHTENLKLVDKSMGSLNSMDKIFKDYLPNGMKKKNINKEEITAYLNANNLKIKDYTLTSGTSKMDFAEEHIKKQIDYIFENYFTKKFASKIKNVKITIQEPKSADDNAMVDDIKVRSGRKTFLGMKTRFKYQSSNILNSNIVEVIATFVFNDDRQFRATMVHVGLKLDKERCYPIIQDIINRSLSEPEKANLSTYLKQQDKKIKSIIFEEQKKLLEEQVREIEQEKDNSKILMNIVKRIHKTQKQKSYMNDFVVGSSGRSSSVSSFVDRQSRIGDSNSDTLRRRIEDQLDTPINQTHDENTRNDINNLFVNNTTVNNQDPDLVEMLKTPTPFKGGTTKKRNTKKRNTKKHNTKKRNTKKRNTKKRNTKKRTITSTKSKNYKLK